MSPALPLIDFGERDVDKWTLRTVVSCNPMYTRAAVISNWPLEHGRRTDGMGAVRQIRKKWSLWATLVVFFVVGLLLIWIPELTPDHGVLKEVSKEIGIAFLTSAILGGSIHVYLERDIAKNAFEGAIGYFLPDDIKEAVRSISGIEWFAEEFSLSVEIQRSGDDLVGATIKIRRLLRNITVPHGNLWVRNRFYRAPCQHS